jgi:hypothetical protein
MRDECGDLVPDQEGGMYADLAEARRAAVSSAWEMMAEAMRFEGRWVAGRAFEIRDENGALLVTVHFADLVRGDASHAKSNC